MGRKSERENRRREITQAFGRVLANHGFAGATMTAVAEDAGLSPGLLHHHFKDKNEMLDELLTALIGSFKKRFSEFSAAKPAEHKLECYINAALKLDQNSDLISAKCWVGLLAEALRNPVLFNRVKRHLENEVKIVSEISGNNLDEQQSSALIAFVFGALVFGAFAPRKAAGFAAPAARRLITF
jgi:TetR/AcrR family transcriptional repressor of bet genes